MNESVARVDNTATTALLFSRYYIIRRTARPRRHNTYVCANMCVCVGATSLSPFYYIILSLYVCLLSVFQPPPPPPPPLTNTIPRPPIRHHLDCTAVQHAGKKKRNYDNKYVKCKKMKRSLRVVILSMYAASASLSSTDGVQTNGFL